MKLDISDCKYLKFKEGEDYRFIIERYEINKSKWVNFLTIYRR